MAVETIDIGTPIARQVIAAVTATGITAANLLNTTGQRANRALVTIETNQVRFTIDGAHPTSTVGTLLPVGTYLFKGEKELEALEFINTAAGAAAITIQTGRKLE